MGQRFGNGQRITDSTRISNDALNEPQIFTTTLDDYVKTKKATLLIAGYPIGYGEFTPPAEEFEKFQNELARKLESEIISDYRDYFIPYEYFYGTGLHLTEKGAEIRTKQLIQDIKNYKRQN